MGRKKGSKNKKGLKDTPLWLSRPDAKINGYTGLREVQDWEQDLVCPPGAAILGDRAVVQGPGIGVEGIRKWLKGKNKQNET